MSKTFQYLGPVFREIKNIITNIKSRLQECEDKAPKDGVYPFAIAGADGKTPFFIDSDGYAHYVQKYFKADASGIAHTDDNGEKVEELKTGIADFAVADANGKILFYVLDGKMRIHAIDVDTIINGAFTDAVTNIRELKTSKYAEGNFDSEINMFICYGQSWAGGYDASAITRTQRYDNIMLNTGIKNNPLNDTSQTATSFVPMVEENGTSSGSGSQTVGETPVSAQSNMVKQLIESENGYSYGDFPYQILGTSPGYGSQTLAQLSKNTNWYARLIAQVQIAYDIATALNKKLVVQAFSWAQGDLGTGLTGTYAENLEQLRADIDADVKAITGQTQTVKCITWQAFLYTNGQAKQWYEKYVGASETYPNIICSGATYHLDNVAAGNLHFTAESQDWLGAYFGIAYKRTIIDGQKFIPVKPVSASHNGNALWVKFNVPQKPLVWDTDRVAIADNYGFNLYDSGGTEKALTSVEIVSPDTVKFVCSSAIADTDYLTYGQNGTTYNRLTGNRGNLRDTQGDYLTYLSGVDTVLPMHNWCVIFNKTVAEMEG